MTFASGWALAGLVLLVPLVALHLRDRGRRVREVPSLVVWRKLDLTRSVDDRRRRLPRPPLALLLAAAALILLVLTLAQPRGTAATPVPGRVVVLDDSLWMSARGRLAAAERLVSRIARDTPAGAPIAIVLAGAVPSTIYRGSASGVGPALAHVAASAAPADLAGALTIAAGLLGGPADRVTVIRAPEDAMPRSIASHGELRDLTVGAPLADEGIFDASARCGIGSAAVCEIHALVRNSAATAVVDRYTAQVAGRPPLIGQVRVAPHASAPITLTALPGENVTLRLPKADALPADNVASVSLPGAGGLPSSSVVTLVGTPARSLALAQAFASVPGVTLRLRTPATYRAGDARSSGLVVLDGWVPPGALPPAPAVLLVDPPRLAGGRVGAPLADTVVSGSDAASPLLAGVEVASLEIDQGAERELELPSWIVPVAWSPGGPLLAAGDDGRRRVAVLAFEPQRSNLPRIPSFPLLVSNLVRWAAQWAPPTATAGVPVLVDATPGARSATLSERGAVVARARLAGAPVALTPALPGLYTVVETGPGVRREAVLAVNASSAGPSARTAVDLHVGRAGARAASAPSLEVVFLAAALAVLALEWLVASGWRTGPVR